MFMVQILGAVAQLERSMIWERAIAWQVATRERGTTWGGKPLVITDDQLKILVKQYETGLYTWEQLGATLGQKPKAVYLALAKRKKGGGPCIASNFGPVFV